MLDAFRQLNCQLTFDSKCSIHVRSAGDRAVCVAQAEVRQTCMQFRICAFMQ